MKPSSALPSLLSSSCPSATPAVWKRVSMAAAASARDDLTDEVPSKRLEILAQQLRLYKPIPATTAAAAAIAEEGIRGGGALSQQIASGGPSASFARKNMTLIKRSAKRAAVLICLFEGDDGEIRVILTKRSANLSSHSGEVSLPGGKAEEGDANDAETALREAKEEIGLDPSSVTVVAVLEPFLSKHLLRVAPVVCILPNKESFPSSANESEVDAIFDAPLEMFLKNEKRRWEEREWLGLKFLVHFFDFQCEKGEFVIWGLTAQILIRTASVLFQRPPEFVEQTPEFHVLNQCADSSVRIKCRKQPHGFSRRKHRTKCLDEQKHEMAMKPKKMKSRNTDTTKE